MIDRKIKVLIYQTGELPSEQKELAESLIQQEQTVRIISRFSTPVDEEVEVSINGKLYRYFASSYIANKFERLLKVGGRFKTLNWFKKNAVLVERR